MEPEGEVSLSVFVLLEFSHCAFFHTTTVRLERPVRRSERVPRADKMKSGVYQFLIGCFAALGSFLFGYDL